MNHVFEIIICLLSLDFISCSSAQQLSSEEELPANYFIKVPQKYLDFPWHVAIYDVTKKKFVCDGVIISPRLVITASRCFYNEIGKTNPNVKDYEIVVSKVTVDYSVRDNEDQKVYEVNKILFVAEGPSISKNNHANDIAILILEESIAFGETISPACLDWASKKFRPQERTQGTVVGMPIYPNGNSSKTFQTEKLPFISLQGCLTTLPEGKSPTLTSTSDKFCAGFEGKKADETTSWGSGAGLVFLENSSYYVRGLFSATPSKKNNIAAFTDLAKHTEWIAKVRDKIEKNRLSREQNFKCGTLNPAGPSGPSAKYWYIPK